MITKVTGSPESESSNDVFPKKRQSLGLRSSFQSAPVEIVSSCRSSKRKGRLSGWKSMTDTDRSTRSSRSSATATTLASSLDFASDSPMSSNDSFSGSNRGRPRSLPRIVDSSHEQEEEETASGEEDRTSVSVEGEESGENSISLDEDKVSNDSSNNLGMEDSISLNGPSDPSVEDGIEVTLEDGYDGDLYNDQNDIDPYQTESTGIDYFHGIEGEGNYYSEEDTSDSSEPSAVRGYYTEETASRSSTSQGENESQHDQDRSLASLEPPCSHNTFSEPNWEPLQSGSGKATAKHDSVGSGISISTYSDCVSMNQSVGGNSLRGFSDSTTEHTNSNTKSKENKPCSEQSFESIGSQLKLGSWKWDAEKNEEVPANAEEESFNGHLSESKNSLSSWNSSASSYAHTSAPNRWSAQPMFPVSSQSRLGELSEWMSEEEISESEEEDGLVDSPAIPQDHNQKPRSAYDKNAPWYCGEDNSDGGSVDSDNSDSSSVMSHLKKSNKKSNRQQKRNDRLHQPKITKPDSDGSMSFGQLAKSLTLSNIESNVGSEVDTSQAFYVRGPPRDKPISALSFGSPVGRAKHGGVLPEASMKLTDLIEEEQGSVTIEGSRIMSKKNQRQKNEADERELEDDETELGHSIVDDATAIDTMEKGLIPEILDSRWTRRAVYTCSAIFLLFDIALVIALLATR